MKRTLLINLPLLMFQAVSIFKADAFGYRKQSSIDVNLNEKGEASVELEILLKNSTDAYLLVSNEPTIVFWIHKGDGSILLANAKRRAIYPSINLDSLNDEMDLLNFNDILNRYISNKPITSREEISVLNDYFCFANNDELLEDNRMDEIDKGLSCG